MKNTSGFVARGLAILLLVTSLRATGTEIKWRRVVEVAAVEVIVHTVSYNELAHKQQSVRWGDMRVVRQTHRHGYAELFRNRATGAFTCHVYVTRDMTREVLEHEQKHCEGWTH